MKQKNIGSSFDSWLREEGLYIRRSLRLPSSASSPDNSMTPRSLERRSQKTDNRLVPRLYRISVIAILLIAATSPSPAEEKSTALRKADLVVVGQLKFSSYFLSVDGVHMNGSITPTEILYGSVKSGVPLTFRYMARCSVFDAFNALLGREVPFACNYRVVWEHWAESKTLLTQPSIWALWHSGSDWTAPIVGLKVFYALSDREYAIRTLKWRTQTERGELKP